MRLNNRLMLCASMVREGSRIVDVGTDHAYLPIWLAKENKIKHAIACDINRLPLQRAKENINLYGLCNMVETRLSDGLKKISVNEVDDIVIAGMGGELISSIIENSKWKDCSEKRFILQPMSSESNLRRSLCEKGYVICKEKAVMSEGRIYTVMTVLYENKRYIYDECYQYIGKITESTTYETNKYIEKQIRDLNNRLKGAILNNNDEMKEHYLRVLSTLSKLINNT